MSSHEGSRKVCAVSYTIGLVGIALVIVFGGMANNYYDKANNLNWEMQKQSARITTGPCGNSQMVVVDKDTIAVAGETWSVSEANSFTFREEADEQGKRLVVYRDGRVIMKRPLGPRQ